MSKSTNRIDKDHKAFIEAQPLFFVATAPEEGHINLSPKGEDSLRILSETRVVWLNLTGSGNETAAHLLENARMTLMFCAFEGKPLILRLYGIAKALHPRDTEWDDLINLFPSQIGPRQIIDLQIERVSTSCGWGVPLMALQKDRTQLTDWAKTKGEEGIKSYWAEKNQLSIDGKATQILDISSGLPNK